MKEALKLVKRSAPRERSKSLLPAPPKNRDRVKKLAAVLDMLPLDVVDKLLDFALTRVEIIEEDEEE